MSCDNDAVETSHYTTGTPTVACGNTSTGVTIEQISHLLDAKIAPVSKSILDLKDEFSTALKTLREEFSRTSDFLNAQIENVIKEAAALKLQVKSLEGDNAKMKLDLVTLRKQSNSTGLSTLMLQVSQLQTELDERDQASLYNDVDISGIPENSGESVYHLVKAAAAKVGVILEEQDIVSAERVGPLKRKSGAGEASANGTDSGTGNTNSLVDSPVQRPRPIVVRLARRALCDGLLKQARLRRNTTTEGLGLPPHTPKPIYINERLTRLNRTLFARARIAGREQGWKYVWTRRGRVYARKSYSDKVHYLRTLCDLDKVFGLCNIVQN